MALSRLNLDLSVSFTLFGRLKFMAGHGAHSSQGKIDPHALGHVVPLAVYWRVFATLVVLTIVTVIVAKHPSLNFGKINILIALFIASVKAMCVALFFMHLKYEKPTTWLYAAFPIVLLFILIGLLFIDNPLRTKVEPMKVQSSTL